MHSVNWVFKVSNLMNYKVYTKIKRTFVVVVQWLSCVWLFVTPWTIACQSLLSFTISQSCSNSYPLSWWWYLTITCSAVLYSFYLWSFPASGSFPMSWLLVSGDQSIGTSASPSVPSSEYSELISFRID